MKDRIKNLKELIESCISRAHKFVENSQTDKNFPLSWLKNAQFEVDKGKNWLDELKILIEKEE